MIDIFIITVIALALGAIIGLLPGVPAYIIPLFLVFFVDKLSLEEILLFWICAHVGSQYFGSVAAILLKIPAESSALMYINDVSNLPMGERINLIRQTAWGSTIGTVTGLLMIAAVYYLGIAGVAVYLTSTISKLLLLTFIIFVMCWFTKRRWIAFGLMLLGIILSEKTNRELPIWVFDIQNYTTDITLFSMILGLMIIPELIQAYTKMSNSSPTIDSTDLTIDFSIPLKFKPMLSGTWIGSIIGLIPGPSNILASLLSYKHLKKQGPGDQIIGAETANNSSTILSMLPFLYIGIPITVGEFLLFDLLQIKLITIPQGFFSVSFIPGFNIIEICFLIILVSTIVYHFTAQHFLKFYCSLLNSLLGKLKLVFFVIIASLIYLDLYFNPVYVIPYISGIIVLTLVGWKLMRLNISAIPLLFGFLLGDMITWTLYQSYFIYFA